MLKKSRSETPRISRNNHGGLKQVERLAFSGPNRTEFPSALKFSTVHTVQDPSPNSGKINISVQFEPPIHASNY